MARFALLGSLLALALAACGSRDDDVLTDAGTPDAGSDLSAPDLGGDDLGTIDAGDVDTGPVDGGPDCTGLTTCATTGGAHCTVDPCSGLPGACSTPSRTCEGNVLVTCAPSPAGCLYESR